MSEPHFERMRAGLVERGLNASQIGSGKALRVSNPGASRMSDTVVLSKGAWWIHWNPPHRIGPADDVANAADVIARVLSAAQ